MDSPKKYRPTGADLLLDGAGWAPLSVAAVAWHLTERQLRRRVRNGSIRSRQIVGNVTVYELPGPA